MPSLSVVIPTHDRPGSLAELLETLVTQDRLPDEVLVVNDAGASVAHVAELYPELAIRVIDLPINGGHVAARNVGVAAATGDWIMPCDDDDLLLPGHLARMGAALANQDLVYCDVEIFGYRLEEGVRHPTTRDLFAYVYDPAFMRRFSTFVASGCLYRRALHDALGPFDENLVHYWDWDFYLRVAADHRVARVPVATVAYAALAASDQQSADPVAMRPDLERLCAKHGLGSLPSKNFATLLVEPEVEKRRAPSQRVWDGQPVISRLSLNVVSKAAEQGV